MPVRFQSPIANVRPAAGLRLKLRPRDPSSCPRIRAYPPLMDGEQFALIGIGEKR